MMSIAASAMTVNFWTFVMSISIDNVRLSSTI